MIGLIACCKTKLDRAAPVRELYTSPLFRMSLAYAEARCNRVYVVSAQHDLLMLGRVLAPYNRTMASLTPMQRKLFGAAVARALVDRHGSPLELMILAGASYVEPICAGLARERVTVHIHEPLAGMQIGERLSFLSNAKPAALPVSDPAAPPSTSAGAPQHERDGATPHHNTPAPSRSGRAQGVSNV